MGNKENLFLSKLDEIKKMMEEKKPKAEIARFLGIKYDTLAGYFKKYDIHYDGNQNRRGLPHKDTRKPLEDILNNKIVYSMTSLKKRLIEEGLKENKCEICGISEWNGKKIQLELHHIDGNHYNNHLENLQILCPNCHSQTEHFRGRLQKIHKNKQNYDKNVINETLNEINSILIDNTKPIKQIIKKEKTKKYCECCGKELTKGSQNKYCSYECSHKAISKRPTKEDLIKKLIEYKNNKTAIGRYYNVSDNAVRKWMIYYEII